MVAVKNRRSKRLKAELRDMALASTFHGIANIFRTDKLFIRVPWIIACVFAWTLFGYLVYWISIDYKQYETVTNINVYHSHPARFPAVIFCNKNYLQPIDFSQYGPNMNYTKELENIYETKSSMSEIWSAIWLLNYRFKNNVISHWLDAPREVFDRIYNETVVSCLFNFVPCGRDNFEIYFDRAAGVCFEFNSYRTLKENGSYFYQTTDDGVISGLQIAMYLNGDSMFTFPDKGALVVVRKNEKKSISLGEGFSVSTGITTNIVVNKVNIISQPEPYSKCQNLDGIDDFDSSLYRQTFEGYNDYTQSDCFHLCLQEKHIKLCACHNPAYSSMGDKTPCLNSTQQACLTKNYLEFIHKDRQKLCPSCPLECEKITFPTSLSFSTLSDEYVQLMVGSSFFERRNLSKSVGIEVVKKNLVSFTVCLEDLKYTNITESAKLSLVDVVAGVGGFSGLLLGASLLSTVEIFEGLLTIMTFGLVKKKNREDALLSTIKTDNLRQVNSF